MPTRKAQPKTPGRWESPPQRTAYDWQGIADILRKHPGEWRLIFERDRVSLANAVRQGSIAALRSEDGFQVMTRKNKTGTDGVRTCALYLRYAPDQ